MQQKISLATALTGGQFVVTHLDNRKLLIKINPGEVIKPGKAQSKSINKNKRNQNQKKLLNSNPKIFF